MERTIPSTTDQQKVAQRKTIPLQFANVRRRLASDLKNFLGWSSKIVVTTIKANSTNKTKKIELAI
jgi:hypothetical protein